MTTYYEKFRILLDEAGILNKELTFGCEIIDKKGLRWIFIGEYEGKKRFIYSDFFTHIDFDIEFDFIIGHPYGIAEVLRWFDGKKYKANISEEGNLFIDNGGEMVGFIKLDLSKPLSEQEEAMENLYNLAISLK